jgi:hypothetical protein
LSILKVLHVWDVAGVALTISKYLRRFDVQSEIILRKNSDKYGIRRVYNRDIKAHLCYSLKDFYLKVLKLSKRYHIIHVHSLDKIIPVLRWIYPEKKIVLHYHGSDIRGKSRCLKKRIYIQFSSIVLVSTEDLLQHVPNAYYLPNPIDTEFFSTNRKLKNDYHGRAVYFLKYPDSEKELKVIKKIAEEKKLKLTVINTLKGEYVPYYTLPEFLSNFEFFIDQVRIPSLSKTALEALSLGLKVIRWDKRILDKFSPEHDPYNVVKKLVKIYYNLVRRN